MKEGRFREDLYHRLNVFQIDVPPLRERIEDLPELAGRMLSEVLDDGWRSRFEGMTAPALDALRAYRWLGNLRQLRNALQRAALLGAGPTIDLDDLPGEVRESGGATKSVPFAVDAIAGWDSMSLREVREAAIESIESAYLRRLLELSRGVIHETAARAGIRPRSLYDKSGATTCTRNTSSPDHRRHDLHQSAPIVSATPPVPPGVEIERRGVSSSDRNWW